MRLSKKWNQAGAKSIAQMANAIAASCWKLGANLLLNLENENFETSDQAQRVDIIEEVLCFLAHNCDRRIYQRVNQAQRDQFITSLVRDLARMLEDSRIDVQGPGSYQEAFVDKLNRRASDYASYSFSEAEGASFAMRCRFGERVQAAMGERDSKWIPDYIVGREAPEIEHALKRALSGLLLTGFDPV